MKRKSVFILLTMSAIFFWICPVMAGNILVDRELFEKIYKRQIILEKKIRQLDHSDKKNDGKPQKFDIDEESEKLDIEQDDFDEISERLDTIETKSILDKIQLTGSLRTRYDSFQHIDDPAEDGETTETWSNRFRLNLKSTITKNIIFHGRLSNFKLWGDNNFPTLNDFDGNHSANAVSTDLYVERAYIDYFIPQTPLSVTFGRLPTTGGPPTEYRDNTTRKATWPKLMTSTEADGIILNTSLEEWTGLTNGIFRIAYNKNLQDIAKKETATSMRSDDTRSLTAAFEMAVPGVKNSILWLSYIKVFDLRTPPDSVLPDGVSIIDKPRDSGDFDVSTFHLQFDNIFNSGLDLFGTYCHNEIHPNSELTQIGIGNYVVTELGLYTDKTNPGQNHSADAFFLGFRYTLPIKSMNYPKFGFEYNYGSKYFMGNILTSEGGEIINKLGIHGKAYEAYFIQPINAKHMFLRIGGIYIDHEYYSDYLFFGNPSKSNKEDLNIYALVDVRF